MSDAVTVRSGRACANLNSEGSVPQQPDPLERRLVHGAGPLERYGGRAASRIDTDRLLDGRAVEPGDLSGAFGENASAKLTVGDD